MKKKKTIELRGFWVDLCAACLIALLIGVLLIMRNPEGRAFIYAVF